MIPNNHHEKRKCTQQDALVKFWSTFNISRKKWPSPRWDQMIQTTCVMSRQTHVHIYVMRLISRKFCRPFKSMYEQSLTSQLTRTFTVGWRSGMLRRSKQSPPPTTKEVSARACMFQSWRACPLRCFPLLFPPLPGHPFLPFTSPQRNMLGRLCRGWLLKFDV